MIKEWIKQAQAEGTAQFFVVYANIGNDSDELIVCEPEQADAEGAEIVSVECIEHSNHLRTMIITAEVK